MNVGLGDHRSRQDPDAQSSRITAGHDGKWFGWGRDRVGLGDPMTAQHIESYGGVAHRAADHTIGGQARPRRS